MSRSSISTFVRPMCIDYTKPPTAPISAFGLVTSRTSLYGSRRVHRDEAPRRLELRGASPHVIVVPFSRFVAAWPRLSRHPQEFELAVNEKFIGREQTKRFPFAPSPLSMSRHLISLVVQGESGRRRQLLTSSCVSAGHARADSSVWRGQRREGRLWPP